MSPGMRSGVQCTPEETIGFNAWHWLKTQEVGIWWNYVFGVGVGKI